MSYINVETVLPEKLVADIQKYVDGTYLYIPKLEENKKAWGEGTETRSELSRRNRSIYEDHCKGMRTQDLADHYYLSVKSIQRIVLSERRKRELVS